MSRQARYRCARLAATCLLTVTSVGYIAVVATNTTPHGRDLIEQSKPLPVPTSFRLVPPTRVDNPVYVCTTPDPHPCPKALIATHNVPDGKCREDQSCWDCATMGNHVCGVKP